MAEVSVNPLPNWYLKNGIKTFLPRPPQVFDGEPTKADIAFALALIEALDEHSQHWYGQETKRLHGLLADLSD